MGLDFKFNAAGVSFILLNLLLYTQPCLDIHKMWLSSHGSLEKNIALSLSDTWFVDSDFDLCQGWKVKVVQKYSVFNITVTLLYPLHGIFVQVFQVRFVRDAAGVMLYFEHWSLHQATSGTWLLQESGETIKGHCGVTGVGNKRNRKSNS